MGKSKKNRGRNPSNTITFLYSNTRSIKNKFTELEAIVETECPDIIGLTETWLDSEKNEFISEFNIEGYTLINKDRKSKRGGGVLIYIRDYLKPIRVESQTNNEKVETVWAQLTGDNNQRVNIGVVYRPPNQTAEIDDLLYGEINYQITRNHHTVIMGDFNLPDINWDNIGVRSYYTGRDGDGRELRQTSSEKFIELMQNNFLVQNVNEPTRNDNLLDLVLSTEENLVQNVN